MKKRMLVLCLLLASIALFAVGCQDEGQDKGYATMVSKGVTDIAEFKTIPYMETKGNYMKADDYGNKDYVLHISETTMEEYQAYVKKMSEVGFKKHSESNTEEYSYVASFTKDNLTVSVSYSKGMEMTYISTSYDRPLSDHLIYKEDYVKDQKKEKTKVHMLQMTANQGSSFIYELKNGHFVVFDGGLQKESTNFINYIKELTPEGQKPVIEAWFVSHCHNDHYGVMLDITQKSYLINQIYVNGFYYVEPNEKHFTRLTTQPDKNGNALISKAYRLFKTEDGGTPEFYRPVLGEKYYFCDIEIDIAMTLEQIPFSQFTGTDFNDTSTWMMCHQEGQKFLFAGDASKDGCKAALSLYDSKYLTMDIFSPFHHGINVYDFFIEKCTYDVVLYDSFRAGSIWDTRADLAAVAPNDRLKAKAKEVYHHGDGSVVLTFPYTIGTAEIGEDWEDVYNPL